MKRGSSEILQRVADITNFLQAREGVRVLTERQARFSLRLCFVVVEEEVCMWVWAWAIAEASSRFMPSPSLPAASCHESVPLTLPLCHITQMGTHTTQVRHDLLEFHDLHVAELYGARNRSHHEVDLVITLGGKHCCVVWMEV